MQDIDPSAPFLSQFSARLNNIAPSIHNTTTSTSPTTTSAQSKDMAQPPAGATMDDKKRLTACLVCRKRKLKCDSARPKCASCTRLGHAWYIFLDFRPDSQWIRRNKKEIRPQTRLCQKTRAEIPNT
jgi:Fungal Zn(2)-Cys(6) binuclear cluster domain